MTDSEFYHQQAQEREDAERLGRDPRLTIGKVWVQENAMERIGALCFIRRREAHHEMAAERFKALYEARYGIGNPALDASRVVVDTSPIAHDSGMAAKIDNTWRLKQAEDYDKPMFNRLVALLVLCEPAGDGLSSRPRQRNVDLVLNDLDRLSTLWGLVKRAA